MPRMSLELVVVAIVILVVALVVLTIFGTGMGPFGWFSSPKNLCIQQFSTSCQSTNYPPTDWGVQKYKDSNGVMQSCQSLATCVCSNHVPTCT